MLYIGVLGRFLKIHIFDGGDETIGLKNVLLPVLM